MSPRQASGPDGGQSEDRAPVTLRTLRRMAASDERFACLACYDATTARWLERGGVHVLLAGDSAAQVVLGYDRTIDMPLDFAVAITAAIKRGAPSTLVMADMPFLSYHADDGEAIRNAGRFMREGLADVVKLEADASFAPLVERMTRAGIAVCAHIGLRPQNVSVKGGYVAEGRTRTDAERIVADAVALERAGAVMLLIEAVPGEAAEAVVDATEVPVIGIGAGVAPHGQILVVNDLVGLTDRPPRFAEPVADLGPRLQAAASEWVDRVSRMEIGGQLYRMKEKPGTDRNGPSERTSVGRGR